MFHISKKHSVIFSLVVSLSGLLQAGFMPDREIFDIGMPDYVLDGFNRSKRSNQKIKDDYQVTRSSCCNLSCAQALQQVLKKIQKQCCACNAPTPISTVPITISQPGCYCVTADLVHTPTTGTAAITITASNVKIDFENHTLTLSTTNPGIVASGVSNILIHNGTITCATPSSNGNSNGIDFRSVQRVVVDNMIFSNIRRGIVVGLDSLPSVDITVSNCEFNHPSAAGRGFQTIFGRGINIENCVFGQIGNLMLSGFGDDRDIRINNCQFLNTNNATSPEGIRFINGTATHLTSNIEISNCSLNNCSIPFDIFRTNDAFPLPTNIMVRNCTSNNHSVYNLFEANNVLIENCLISSSTSNVNLFSNLVLDDGYNRIVRNCTFLYTGTGTGFTANVTLSSLFGNPGTNNFADLFENCTFHSNASGTSANLPGATAANLVIIDTANVRVVNSIFSANPQLQVNSLSGNKNIVFDSCSFSNGVVGNILFAGTSESVIKNCTITTSSGYGIQLSNSDNNLIEENNIQNNATDGLLISGTASYNTIKNNVVSNNGDDGISFSSASNFNVVIYNTASNNVGVGFNNVGGPDSSEFYHNRACNNGTNYVGVSPTQAPGTPSLAADNIDCSL